jgi:RHS repeat-associated protein
VSGGAISVAAAELPGATTNSLDVPGASAAPAEVSGGGGTMALLTVTSAGRTPGQFAVSAMGAATYQISIWTPPGARGIEPKLALVYTSGSPDGVMGPGWNLSGLSAIARCNKTYADNAGVPALVALTTSDDFCLDGNRLRVTTFTTTKCNSGATGTVYYTEVANFSRITACGTAGNGPSYFIVERKDGLIYEYGNTADSKAYASGGTTPYAWMLNKVRDRESSPDNLIITYSTTSGAIQPATIKYTQTPSTNGTIYPYTVSFSYQNRVTNLSKYVAGGSIQQTKVLSKIDVKLLGITSAHQYNMTYATAPTTQRDRLISVQECAGSTGTDCLRATGISYQDGVKGVDSPTTSSGSGVTNGTVYSVDVDGNGRLDLVFATTSGANYQWWVQLATPSGYAAPISTGAVTTGTAGFLVDDFDATGGSEIVAPVGNTWYAYKLNGAAFSATSTGVPYVASDLYSSADIDGDGRPDLLELALSGTNNFSVRLNTSTGGGVSFAATAAITKTFTFSGNTGVKLYGDNQSPNSPITRYDFNGDGRSDFIISAKFSSTWTAWEYAYNGTTIVTTGGANLGTGTVANPFVALNFNEDACTDLMGTTQVQISGCNGSTYLNVAISATALMGIDWDADGRTDVLTNANGVWQVYRSLGTAFATAVSTGIPVGSGTWNVSDNNGDGLADLVLADAAASNALKYGLHKGPSTPPDLVTSIADGWNVSAAPTYVPITTSNYTKYSGAVFPEMDVQGAIYVVSQALQTDGIGGNFTTSYSYFGARANRQGRGFEGFAITQAQDSRNLLYHLVTYNQVFPFTGTVAVDRVYQSNGTSLISRTDNAYQVMTLNDLTDTTGAKCKVNSLALDTRCFPYLSQVSASQYELNGTPVQATTATYAFDQWGTQTSATTTTTDMDPSSPEYHPNPSNAWTTTIANTSITNDTSNWCLGKPTVTTSTSSEPDALPAGNATTQTRHVNHAVDVVKCRYTSETVEPSTLLEVATTFGYDTCGNVNSVSIAGKKSNGINTATRTTTSNYGTRCTFPETVTNALLQVAQNGYNYTYGVRSSTTDPNGISVSWGYDNFGRKTSETRPDGTSTTWAFVDCVTASCFGVSDKLRLQITETLKDSAAATVRTHVVLLDAFERSRYEQVQRVLGTSTYTRVNYDALGRKVDEYQPYPVGGYNGRHHFEYDVLNRPTADQLYRLDNSADILDRTVGMTYAGLLTTLTDARGNKTWKWADVTGKLRRIIDPDPVNGMTQGATTYYDYDPFGNLVRMKDAGGVETTHVYNIRGFRTSSSDPDAGNWTYTPNSLNELTQHVDAKGQTTTIDYDVLGRMTFRTEPEGSTAIQWTYGTSAAAHEIGRLKNVIKPDGYREDYTFDGIGRPAQSTYTEDATAYTINYTYNTIGAVDTVQYPTSSSGYRFALKYVYSYGYVQQVKDNAAGTVFWSLNAASDYSSPTSEVLGNGAKITSGYRAWTNEVLTRQVGTGTSTNNLQDLSYQWDPNGNLSQRQAWPGQPQQLTETFGYDTLNRLSTVGGVNTLTVGYSAGGNIGSKSDVGSYDYTTQQAGCSYTGLPAQPHAVRNAGGTVFCYDTNGNMTSRGGSWISWYSYNQPNKITSGSKWSQFAYDVNHQRWKQITVDGTGTTTTLYIAGIMEKLSRPGGIVEYRHIIPAGSGSAIYLRKPDGTNSTTYLSTDHLGSGDLILDSSANVLARESFTAFGSRRGSNWTGTPTSGDYTTFSNTTRRGFTGHEMLDAVGLVNMNGRIYDPLIGRFLSADAIIPTINLSQALNPYSYVMNMPLTLTDPSGYSWLGDFLKKWGGVILNVVMVAVFHVPPLAAMMSSAAFSAVVNGGNFMQGFISGMVIGAITAGIADGIGLGDWAARVIGDTGHGLLNAVLQGALVGALTGGAVSLATGGSFWAGFTGGALGGAVAGGMTWGAKRYLKAASVEGAAAMSSDERREEIQKAIDKFKSDNPQITATFENDSDTWVFRIKYGASDTTRYFESYDEAVRAFDNAVARYGYESVEWADAEVKSFSAGTVHVYAPFAGESMFNGNKIYGWVPTGDMKQAILWHETGHVSSLYGGGGYPGYAGGWSACAWRSTCEADATQWARQHYH